MTKHCVIVDIDGTLADNEHRVPLVRNEPKDWDTFFDGIPYDKPINSVVRLVRILDMTTAIILCSGRPEKYRMMTTQWLLDQDVPYDHLFMRRTNDHRPDDIVKKELLQRIREHGYDPWLVIDDRNRVVNMWRNEGLVCLQCAEGNF